MIIPDFRYTMNYDHPIMFNFKRNTNLLIIRRTVTLSLCRSRRQLNELSYCRNIFLIFSYFDSVTQIICYIVVLTVLKKLLIINQVIHFDRCTCLLFLVITSFYHYGSLLIESGDDLESPISEQLFHKERKSKTKNVRPT